MKRAAQVVGTARLIIATVLLIALFWQTPCAMPLRPDIAEKLRGQRLPFPTRSEMSATGINLPLEKFSLDLSERTEGERTELRAVVILIEFPNLPARRATHGITYYERLLFAKGPWAGNTLREYYLENSYGKLDVIGEVCGWYVAPNSSGYYAATNAGLCSSCYPRNARKLAEDAVQLASADVDFSLFDNDGPDGIPSSGDDDGYVDAVFIVHAGPSFEETGNPNYIMSHQWTTPEPVQVDGVSVYVYTTESEFSKVGTFCHELGHVLGLPDLYDRDYSSYALDLWSLMAAGGWLDEGRSPSHLDAWSKVKLGFVEPVVPDRNTEGVVLRAIERYPEVYKFWKNGRPGKEYFLLENRRKTGFDSPLPGSGLLIYHVDETVENNDNSMRYMVALEQADGMFDLEGRRSPSGFGADAGDPFPGWAYNRNFTNFSVPNTLSNEVRDVEVRVRDIYLEGNLVSFDVTVETSPELVVTRVLTDDTGTGDGDGNPDAGETARFHCEVKNIGLASGDILARASCANAYAELVSDTVRYGFLAQDEVRLPDEAFVFEVDSLLTRDPYRVYFVVDFRDGLHFAQRETLVVAVGDSLGIEDDFESGEGEWTHRGAGSVDDWHLSELRSFTGNSSWRCGIEDTSAYSDYQDSFLRTPFFICGAEGWLSFYQWLDIENENSRLAWDGCMVEVSTDNIHWECIEPIGGYPYVIDMRADTDGAERRCFSGRSREWERVDIDLSDYSGALWIRFRMISDGGVSGEGWYIDDVRVTTLDEPYSIAFETVTASPGSVEIKWQLSPRLSVYNGQGMTLLRSRQGNALTVTADLYDVVYEDTSRLAGLHSFADTTVISGGYYSYAISDITASGGTNWIEGPTVYVPHAVHCVGLTSCSPNPYYPLQGTLIVEFEIPEGTRGPLSRKVRVLVLDITGRVVAVLHDGPAVSGPHRLTWNGTASNGEAVASGIYLVSLRASRDRFSRKVVLLR